jgi:hypothetical protein
MSEYTKGLWRASGDYVVCKIGELSQATICEIYHNEEDAARIVACVNACEGITTEGLEFAYNKNVNPLPNMVTREQLENKIKELQQNVSALQLEVNELSYEVQEAYSRND